MGVIGDQNEVINTNIKSLKTALITNEQLYLHQADLHNTLKLVNYILIFAYAFFFVLIHVLYADQYLRGVQRNEIIDSIFLTVFFLYPYLIYSIEGYFYDILAGIWAYLYSQTSVPSLDSLFTSSIRYQSPVPINSDFQPTAPTTAPMITPGSTSSGSNPVVTSSGVDPVVTSSGVDPVVTSSGVDPVVTTARATPAPTTARATPAPPSFCSSGPSTNTTCSNTFLSRDNCGVKLILDSTGNFYKVDGDGVISWQTGPAPTTTTGPYKLVMQTDGNLVIYDVNNRPTWATNGLPGWSQGAGPPYKFELANDGNFVIFDKNNNATWNAYMQGCSSMCKQGEVCRNILVGNWPTKCQLFFDTMNGTLTIQTAKGTKIWNGAGFQIDNGPYTYTLTNTGNLQIKNKNGSVVWTSDGHISRKKNADNSLVVGEEPYRLVMQPDANLVIYGKNTVIWESATGGKSNL